MTALLAATAAIAQTRRNLVLIEEFTNTGCGPCANYAPTLDSVVSYRLGEAIAIKYHGNYPDRKDPYYLDQKETCDARLALYDISAYPTTYIDGQLLSSGFCSATELNNAIDRAAATERHYGITLSGSLSGGQLAFSATVTPDADVADASRLRLYVVAMEEYYESPTAYANGETEMRYTMRRMLPSADGYELGASLTAGQAYTYSGTATVDNLQDEQQLGLVAFLQNADTREVLATAYVPRGTQATDQMALMRVDGTPDYICTPNLYGQAIFRNVGDNPITQATFNIQVNDQVIPLTWTGHLDYLEKDTLVYSGITDFQLATTGNNSVRFYLSDINGTTAMSNVMKQTMHNSVSAEQAVQLRIYTDNKPFETTWEVLNSADEVVATGGPYTEARKFINEDLPLYADDCYRIVFHDSGEDGIEGDWGNGYYQLQQIKDGKKTRILQDSYDGSLHTVAFRLTNAATASIDRIDAEPTAPALVTDAHGRIVARTTACLLATVLDAQPQGIYVVAVGNKHYKTMK